MVDTSNVAWQQAKLHLRPWRPMALLSSYSLVCCLHSFCKHIHAAIVHYQGIIWRISFPRSLCCHYCYGHKILTHKMLSYKSEDQQFILCLLNNASLPSDRARLLSSFLTAQQYVPLPRLNLHLDFRLPLNVG